MKLIQIFSISIGLLVFSIIALIFGKKSEEADAIERRLKEVKKYGSVDISVEENTNISFYNRFYKPLIDKIIALFGTIIPKNEESLKKISMQIVQAGMKVKPKDYVSTNIIIMLILGCIGVLFATVENLTILNKICYFFVGAFLGYVMRRFQLSSSITKRKELIENSLPEVLDLLSVSVEAGLGFDQALQYVVQRCTGPLIDEFEIVQREISLGRARSESLKRMSERCNLDEIKSFVGVVIQADELGFSIKNVLQTQAASIRLSHKQKIEEKAMKIPVKILIPLVAFIFPVLFIVLLGPAVPSIFSALGV